MRNTRAQIKLFSLFVAVHMSLYMADLFLGFDSVVLLISWLPLVLVSTFSNQLTSTELLIGIVPFNVPNIYGLTMCLIVWLLLYWFISGLIASKVKGFNHVPTISP